MKNTIGLYDLVNLKEPNQIAHKTTYLQIFKDVKQGTYKSQCLAIRECAKVYDALIANKFDEELKALSKTKEYIDAKKALSIAKNKLKCFTISGVFRDNERGLQGLITETFTQIMQVDIDWKENQFVDMKELRNQLITLPYVLSVFTSPSGNGLKCFVKHDQPKENHEKAFLYIEKIFADNFDVVIDKQCKDISRVCFVSYDENIYVNENATSLTIDLEAVKVSENAKNLPVKIYDANYKSKNVFEHCVWLVERKMDFVPGNKSNFRYNVACLLNEYGVSQDQAENFIKANYPNSTNAKSIDCKSVYEHRKHKHATQVFTTSVREKKQYDRANNEMRQLAINAKKGGRTAESLVELAKLSPITANLHPNKIIEIANEVFENPIEEFYKTDLVQTMDYLKKLSVSRNLLTGEVLMGGQIMSKEDKNSLYFDCKNQFSKLKKDDFFMLLESKNIHCFNPFDELIEKYKVMPKEEGYISSLFNTLHLSNNENKEILEGIFRKWFIAFWSQLIGTTHTQKNDLMLVFCGGNNVGKNRFWLDLLSGAGFSPKYYNFENAKEDDVKRVCYQEVFLLVDEISKTSLKKASYLREVLNSHQVTLRPMRENTMVTYRRIASFVGCSNHNDIIYEADNNRRIVPISLLKKEFRPDEYQCYDFEKYNGIDKTKVFAEALQAYLAGEKYSITGVEEKYIKSVSNTHRAIDFDSSVILDKIAPSFETNKDGTKNEKCIMATATQLFTEFEDKFKNVVAFGKAMNELNFPSIQKRSQGTKNVSRHYLIEYVKEID
jgi:hypothetical protein